MMLSRRQFALTAAAAAMPQFSVRWAEAAAPTDRAIVVVFLRGGMDVLNLLAPADDPFYEQSRVPQLRVPLTGDGKGILLGAVAGSGDLLLNANAQPLATLFKAGRLALIPAAGLNNATRSHFQAMELMEKGLDRMGSSSPRDGWLTRVATHFGDPTPGNVLSIGGALPQSLSLCEEALSVSDVWEIDWVPSSSFAEALLNLHRGDSVIDRASRQALTASRNLAKRLSRNSKNEPMLRDAPVGVTYPDEEFGRQLHLLAELLQQNPNVHIASVDLDGWDMHENQPDRFAPLARTLAAGLEAFNNHLQSIGRPTTVVVMSEFGRRIKANESRGTDHGHGGMMMVMDPDVKGGFHGRWPGLAPEQLDQGMDLAVTTDFRDVLASVLKHANAEAAIGAAFPGYKGAGIEGLFKA
jgi:uncharacterized protein (DUF1501 family)